MADSISCLDCPNPTLYPQQDETSVAVTVTNEAGCTASDQLTVRLTRPVYIANAFSPNEDGINDYFFIQTPGSVDLRTFRIFDRRGSLVFQRDDGTTNSHQDGWDGKVKGKRAKPGIYIWQAELIYDGDLVVRQQGDVLLLR